MKKLYLFSLLCCLAVAVTAQTTVTIYATAGLGTYTTGNSTSTVRTDNNIVTNGTTQAGYAVFDLTGIPAGSTVSSVTIGTYILSIAGVGSPTGCNTYGYAGDLSTVTTPATLYADLFAGTSISTTSYGTVTGNLTITPSTAFIQAHVGSKISICFTGGSPRTYTMSGETGTASTTLFNHAPYITITYCTQPTAVTAAASPTTLCSGDMLTLTGSASGATDYSWSGPGGYTSTSASSSLTVSAASAGVYTLTAINSCSTFSATATATTAAVTVNPLPSAITGSTFVCSGSATTLSSAPGGGNWTSSVSGIASVGITNGIVVGNSSGSATISYTLSTGCYVTSPMTVYDAPTPIFGSNQVCVGSTIALFDGSFGGTWSSSLPGTATVGASSGVVTGISPGTSATIDYTTPGCPSVSYAITVNPVPNPIGGPFATVCDGSSITMTDITSGGTWSTGNPLVAVAGSTGVITGMSPGSTNVIYTLTATGCAALRAITVNPLPAAISGPADVCTGATISLTDISGGGIFSGGAPNASVTTGGTVTGITTGGATITYTLPTSCAITTAIAVDAAPSPISGSSTICENSVTTLSDPDIGGYWTSSVPATATVGSSTGLVTGVVAGSVNISYSFPSGCSAVMPVVVNPVPSATITASGPTTFCVGNSVTLTAPAGAGYSYQWNSGGLPVSGETNISYTASASGSITVDVTNAFGCTATSTPVGVTAGFSTSIINASPLNFCNGGNVVLTANTGGAVGSFTYQWLDNGVGITSATGASYTATTSGMYQVVISVAGSSGVCTDTAAAVAVVANPLPTPSIARSGVLLATIGSYSTYQWFLNGVAIPGATNASYRPLTNGLFRVRVGDAIGCTGYSNQIEITGVGVPMVNAETVNIYPNPATDVVHIESPATLRAVITGMDGKELLNIKNAQDINIGAFARGIYIIMLYDENNTRVLVQKLTKE